MGNGRRCISIVQMLLAVLVLMTSVPSLVAAKANKAVPVIFNFGDSNSDTCGLVAGSGIYLPLPYGRVFFGKSTGRFADGRLVLDFLCESVNSRHLSAYLEALGSDFTNGANFAVAGAATRAITTNFTLSVQVLQYSHFRNRSLDLYAHVKQQKEMEFRNALYTLDIGQNDLSGAFNDNLTYAQVLQRIPSILSNIKDSIKSLYQNGGRKFWVHNTGPLGCLPQKLSMFKHESSDLDSCGCLASFNKASKVFNAGLSAVCDELRSELKNATIIYTDMYAIKFDIVCNYRKYGFEHPFTSCCGIGGPPYNFNNTMRCRVAGTSVCPESDRRVSWDGIHYTEAANIIISLKILSTHYSDTPVKFGSFFHPK